MSKGSQLSKDLQLGALLVGAPNLNRRDPKSRATKIVARNPKSQLFDCTELRPSRPKPNVFCGFIGVSPTLGVSSRAHGY